MGREEHRARGAELFLKQVQTHLVGSMRADGQGWVDRVEKNVLCISPEKRPIIPSSRSPIRTLENNERICWSRGHLH